MRGRIGNVSTGLNPFVGTGFSIYTSVKAATDTKPGTSLKRLCERRITVNSTSGPIATHFGGGIVRDDEGINTFWASHTGPGALAR